MLLETFSIKSNPNVDKENGRLTNVVIMSTDFNLNNNATFTAINQKEIVDLGNSTKAKVYCYLGHAKQGATSTDRLPFRLGYFENFRIDTSTVKADLILSPTIESNPILQARFPDGIKPYIYSLAENEASECGFSMCVGMRYNEDDSVNVMSLSSVDLVEDPALTIGLFSKEEPMTDKIIEDVHPTLNFAFDQFNALDTALKSGQPIAELVTALLSSLAGLEAAPEVEPVEETQEIETAPEPALESPIAESKEVEVENSIQSQIDTMKNDIADIKAAVMSFAKQEEPKEEIKEEPVKVIHVMAPIAHERIEESFSHDKFNELKQNRKYTEATLYWNLFH